MKQCKLCRTRPRPHTFMYSSCYFCCILLFLGAVFFSDDIIMIIMIHYRQTHTVRLSPLTLAIPNKKIIHFLSIILCHVIHLFYDSLLSILLHEYATHATRVVHVEWRKLFIQAEHICMGRHICTFRELPFHVCVQIILLRFFFVRIIFSILAIWSQYSRSSTEIDGHFRMLIAEAHHIRANSHWGRGIAQCGWLHPI